MVEQKFRIGDRVIHKSRTGPAMSVKNYEPKDGEDVTCEQGINYYKFQLNAGATSIQPTAAVVTKYTSSGFSC